MKYQSCRYALSQAFSRVVRALKTYVLIRLLSLVSYSSIYFTLLGLLFAFI